MSSLPPVERVIVKQFSKEGKDGMLPVDYISERAIQKSLNRIIGSSLTPEEYKKCIGLIVPLINTVFGEKYGDLRTKKNPDSKPLSEVFRNVFEKVFNKDRTENPDKYNDLDTLSLINDWANKFSESLYSSAIPKDFYRGSKPKKFERPICIIGAGPAGLYTAMILDSFKIKYEILEASDRVGGRIFTKKLEGGATAGAHDYYDVGAMRFPFIPMMSRTFDLFARLDQSNPSDKPEKLKIPDWLREYHLNGDNNPHSFNSRHSADKDVQSGGDDFFCMSVSNGGVVPDGHVKTGFKDLLDAAFKEFKDEFSVSNEKGRMKLKDFDMYSTRAYLALVKGYPAEVIEWCENMNSTAGLFDQAFTESVIRSTEFDGTGTQWHCIEGGSRVFIEKMVEKIRHKPNTLKRVTSIAVAKESGADIMKVEVQGEKGPRLYSHVVSTVPLSCLRCINLDDAMLAYDQHVAIRSLNYDSAVKIGMKFKTRWWQKEGLVYPDQPDSPKFPNIQNGGQGLTDRLIGICVYPSYGLLDDVEKPAVLISSYTLAQDARRLGALIHGKDTKVEARLVDLVLYDLAKLHKMPFDFLKDQMVDHYAHDWYRDENAMGAFALFGPGQFSSTYPALLRPAGKGNLNFVGEALSSQHGWVAGALNSAWRGVDNIFNRMGDKERRKQLRAEWGGVEDLSEATLNLSVLIGTRGPEVAE